MIRRAPATDTPPASRAGAERARAPQACRHCGLPVPPQRASTGYCCAGCENVAALIDAEGLDRYYALRERQTAPARPVHSVDLRWLEALQHQAEAEALANNAGASQAVLTLGIQGLSCLGCVWLVERLALREGAVQRIELDLQRGQTRLHWQPGSADLPALALELGRFGYRIGPREGEGDASRNRPGTTGLLTRMGLCAAFALNAMLFTLPHYLGMQADWSLAPLFQLLSATFASLSVLVGGSYFFQRAWAAARAGEIHIDLPIALGIGAAYAGSLAGWALDARGLLYFDFVSLFVFLMLVGRWLQEHAVEKNRARLLASAMLPPTVLVAQEDPEGGAVPPATGGLGSPGAGEREQPREPWVERPLEALRAGDRLWIAPGATVPVAAEVRTPRVELSLEWINGEAEPRLFRQGQAVPAGAQSLQQQGFWVCAQEGWEVSKLARLLNAGVEPARSPLLERILRSYLIAVLALAAIGGLAWGLSTHWVRGLQVAISVLVVSCPCAIGVAYPLALERAVAQLRRIGLFVRRLGLFARLRHVRGIVFDKTGTLTLDTPSLNAPEALEHLNPRARALLKTLVAETRHPVGRALREALSPWPEAPVAATFREFPGFGVVLEAEDGRWSLGRPGWDGADPDADPDAPGETGAGTVPEADCVFAHNGERVAGFTMAEQLRPGVATVIARLRARGLAPGILSGDRAPKVRAVAKAVGVDADRSFAGLTPEAKARQLRAWGKSLYLGDGINDSLACEVAWVSGTPVLDQPALTRQTDFYLLGHSLDALLALFTVQRRLTWALTGAFGFTVVYNLATATLCLSGQMHPLLAAILMPLSSLTTLGIVTLALGEGPRR